MNAPPAQLPHMPSSEYVDYHELAAYTAIPVRTLRILVAKGIITPAFRMHSHVRFHLPTVLRQLEEYYRNH